MRTVMQVMTIDLYGSFPGGQTILNIQSTGLAGLGVDILLMDDAIEQACSLMSPRRILSFLIDKHIRRLCSVLHVSLACVVSLSAHCSLLKICSWSGYRGFQIPVFPLAALLVL